LEIVAGISLRNLNPRVWDDASPHYLPNLSAVMVSYAEFLAVPSWKRRVEREGLRTALEVPDSVRVYLDNGAFYFAFRGLEPDADAYEAFVEMARPDWYPVPHDYIPTPAMSLKDQRACLERTMTVNRRYTANGYVSVLHASRVVDEYIAALQGHEALCLKPALAVGGLVPNLLRSPKAQPYAQVVAGLRKARRAFADKQMHVFGIGGTATVHLAALLKLDSADSSGWRNRAARGIVQLPGSGDRLVADLGKWRGREPSPKEWETLRSCPCPACQQDGLEGLRASASRGFKHRATHNLSILLEEAAWMRQQLTAGTYAANYCDRLDNSTYKPLIATVVNELQNN
jgi:7-cyano-7-deazaguanine tRNA-ribosyltransferase